MAIAARKTKAGDSAKVAGKTPAKTATRGKSESKAISNIPVFD